MHDVNILDEFLPEAGAFYVIDRGYIDFERLFNCIKQVFGADAKSIPQQTIQNAPFLDARLSEQELSSPARAGQPAVAWNRPNVGPMERCTFERTLLFQWAQRDERDFWQLRT